jgi:5'-nucleotidase
VIDGRPVTSASSFGRLITDIDVTLDRRSRDVTRVAANNRVVSQDVPPAFAITELIKRYDFLVAPLRDRVIGRIATDITRTLDDSREHAAGNLIADAQLASTTPNGAVAAFMNPGGVRADFLAGQISGGEQQGEVTYGEAFTVQPFGNSLVTMDLTGAQVHEMLKQQWCEQTFPRVLLPSVGVKYTWDRNVATAILGQPCAGAGNPVTSLTIGGEPVAADGKVWRITVNSFLAAGGDKFTVLAEGVNRVGGDVDVDALEEYLEPSVVGSPVAPSPLTRIDVTP